MTPNLDTATLRITLSEMLDLALGTAEVGTVNFNILHNFLHILLYLNGLKSTKVEYKGENANKIEKMLSSAMTLEPSLEYSIQNSSSITTSQRNYKSNENIKVDVAIDESVSSESRSEIITASAPSTVRDLSSNENRAEFKMKTEDVRTEKPKINGEKVESVIFVEPLVKEAEPSALSFNALKESVQKLQQQFYEVKELMRNSAPVERRKEHIHVIAQSDTSKEDSDEVETMVRDFIEKHKIERQAGGGDIVDQVAQINKRLSELEDNVNSLCKEIISLQGHNSDIEKKIQFASNSNAATVNYENQENGIQLQNGSSEKQFHNNLKSLSNVNLRSSIMEPSDTDILGEVNCCKLRNDMMRVTTNLIQLKEEMCKLREKIYKLNKYSDKKGESNQAKDKHIKKCTISPEGSPREQYVVIKQKQSDMKPSHCADLICDVESSLTKTIECVDKRFQCFEEYVNCCLKNIQDIISKNKNEEELLQYVKDVRIDFEALRKYVIELQHHKDTQNKQNDVFQEQIEVLKTIKADKEEVEEALIDKADICALNKKVSHEQFDAVCNELTRGLDEVIAKFSQRESIWQQSLGEVRREIERKLDELEIPALKDFINNELQALRNQLRLLLSQIEPEQEAAGARKLLRDLRCISCDKDAYIKTDSKLAGIEPFPCRQTIKPYLTFKMHQVRKQQKILSQGKNLMHLEKIVNENMEKCSNIRFHEASDDMRTRDQFCNRYCGGSHTIISPEQRIKKTKNCVTQWGVHDLQMVEGFVQGTDGKMYRGRWFIGPNDGKVNQSETSKQN